MKTVEQKAKAYDEAIERARLSRLQLLDIGEEATEIEYIFPELKEESEDERIRKGIKSILEHYKESGEVVCPYPFVSIEEALAWLEKQAEVESDKDDIEAEEKDIRKAFNKILNEKQGEKNSITLEEDEKIREQIAYAIRQLHVCECTKNRLLAWLEKQAEQKPDLYPLCTTIKDKIRTYICNNFITDEVVKTDVKSIVHAMEEGVRLGKEENKSDWSEEDEKMVKDIIAAIDTLYYHGMVNWLKSLKERYTWKPSDEQMNALWDKISNDNLPNSEKEIFQQVALTELYEQLKKLKGE